MTKHLRDTLNLPSMEDIIGDDEAHMIINTNIPVNGASDHAESMTVIHDEAIRNARDIYDMAMNIDHSRARGMFEQSANFFKIAMDAKIAKRNAELQAFKMKLESEKVEIAKKMAGVNEIDMTSSVVIVEDRNELLRQIAASKLEV